MDATNQLKSDLSALEGDTAELEKKVEALDDDLLFIPDKLSVVKTLHDRLSRRGRRAPLLRSHARRQPSSPGPRTMLLTKINLRSLTLTSLLCSLTSRRTRGTRASRAPC